MRNNLNRIACLLSLRLLLLVLAGSASAADYTAKVTYISATSAYLDAGRDHGVSVGDTCFVTRNGVETALLIIAFVSDNSSSAQKLDSAARLVVGENVKIHLSAQSESEIADDAASPTSSPAPFESREATRARRDATKFSGRFGFEVASQNARSDYGYDYVEPSAILKLAASKLGGGHHAVSIHARWRNLYRGASGSLYQKSSRIYEAALTYDNPQATWSYGVGRMMVRDLRGIGFLNGAVARYHSSERLNIGVFGGTEPDLRTTEFRSDVMKAGGFASYDTKRNEWGRLQGVVALAGSYEDGEIDREFVYQQLTYSRGSKLVLFESAELNLNRGWKKDAEGSTLNVTGFLLNARWGLTERLALTFAHDTRRSYHTYETRSVPDSLFDDAVRRGFRAQVSAQLSEEVSGNLGASLRTEPKGTADATAEWIQLNWSDIFESGANASADLRIYESAFSKGAQPALTLSRSFARRHRLSLSGGMNRYDLKMSDTLVNANWLRVSADAELGGDFYLSGEAEMNRGTDWESDVYVLGAGYRF